MSSRTRVIVMSITAPVVAFVATWTPLTYNRRAVPS